MLQSVENGLNGAGALVALLPPFKVHSNSSPPLLQGQLAHIGVGVAAGEL